MLETEIPRAFWICGTGIREKRVVLSKRKLKKKIDQSSEYQMDSLITGIMLKQFCSCNMLREGQIERPILYALRRDADTNSPKS